MVLGIFEGRDTTLTIPVDVFLFSLGLMDQIKALGFCFCMFHNNFYLFIFYFFFGGIVLPYSSCFAFRLDRKLLAIVAHSR